MNPREIEEQKKVISKLKIACVLCVSFMIVEVIGGLMAKSLAVLSDAAHLMTDLSR
jgi:zinc transporter 2